PFDQDTLPLVVPGPHLTDTLTYKAPAGQFPQAIPDGVTGPPLVPGIATSSLTIAGDNTLQITDLNVSVSINHPRDADLRISLIGPDGTTVLLSNKEGGAGRDYINTTFDEQSPTPISLGAAPFTGSFETDQFSAIDGIGLGVFNGKFINGTWTLKVEDTRGGNVGRVLGWSLSIRHARVALNQTVDHVNVFFDRDMDPTTLTGASILRMISPTGEITGPFVITPAPNRDPNYPDPDPTHPRTYQIGFPQQLLNGTYTMVLSS